MAQNTPIAVVGMACRFPGADDASRYWDNILHDVCSIHEMPPSRFTEGRYYDPEVGAYGKSYSRLGGLVSEREFDPRPFRMTPKSVAAKDVVQLWMLDVAKRTLEDAGYDPFALEKKNVGVVVGHARGSTATADLAFGTASEALIEALDDVPTLAALGVSRLADIKAEVVRRVRNRYSPLNEDAAVGNMTSAVAGIISHGFGLTGRHMVVDAACASSFAALEIGARALQQGKLDACLVGGASYSQELSVIMFAQSRALSPDGSFPFDKRANGFISSDGLGLFLLRRLDDAIRDGNRIRAVIRGVGGSCDGKGRALWAPRKEGQVLAMGRAYQQSGIDPATVDLIEGHATSTPLGDRTEIESLHEIYAEARGGRPIAVGSVKGNIGHAREAAGAAGLTKAICALEQATLPPTGNFRHPSEEIPWSDVAVEVVTAPRPWQADGPRRVGCNAFGIGGLNYHLIVEEAPPERRVVPSAGLEAPRLEATLAPTERADIAIVGVGARYPGSKSAQALFENLLAKVELASEVPADRWSKAIYHQPGDRARHRTYLARGGFVTDFVADWRRYKMPPKLIERNDPLQFMLLESAMDALEQAGLSPATIDRERTATIMGSVFGSDYALDLALAIRALELSEDALEVLEKVDDEALAEQVLAAIRSKLPSINEDSSGSFSSSTLASRIAKTLDLMGPTYSVDAACASSLASVEAACELLRSGAADLALAGGGDRGMRVQRFEAYCQFYALTKDGQPRPFDVDADGFMPGEGAGVLVLERLEDAQAKGHPVLAVIRGIGGASNGDRRGMHASSPAGLTRAMTRAFSQTSLPPDAVDFVECHGGATPLGDRTEVEAVRTVYGPRSRPLTLGTIKSTIGHTQGAAGVASLIKATLALHDKKLPPTLGHVRPHPDHAFGDELRVNTTAEAYAGRAVAVSAMGLAGINYHAVLESAAASQDQDDAMSDSEITTPSVVPAPANTPPVRVLQLRAQTATALVERFVQPSAQDVLSNEAPGEGPAVLCVAADNVEEVARAQALLKKTGLSSTTRELREKQGLFARTRATARADRIAFMFSGQGSQYPGMMAAFVEAFPTARGILDQVDAWCADHAVPPLSARMTSGVPLPSSVFGVQSMVLAADLVAYGALVDAGIRADVVTGHSYGDYAALVAAGVWSVSDALTATRLRCNAIEGAEVRGAMTSVTASESEVQAILRQLPSDTTVTVANRNAPDQTVLAGRRRDLAVAETRLAEAGLAHQRLEVPGPFHSPLMAGARELLTKSLARVPLRAPQIPYLSSVTGRFEAEPERIRQALVEQLLEPVDFVGQLQRLLGEGITVFVESGPRAVLASLARRIVGDADVVVLSTDDKARPGPWSLGRVHAALECRKAAGVARSPAAPVLATGSHLSVIDGPQADALLSEPGFAEFWARTQPGVTALVERLWEEEKKSVRPTAAPAAITVPEVAVVEARPAPLPEPANETAAEATADATTEAAPPAAPPADPEPSAPASTPAPAGPRPSRDEVQATLLDAMCEESGYPPDIIELDADLEADLGIDTVKQAQVFGRMRDVYALKADEKLALRDFPTMRHVLDYIDQQLDARAKTPATPSRVAVVDLTARREAKALAPSAPAPSAQTSRPPATPRSPSHSGGSAAPAGAEDDAESEPEASVAATRLPPPAEKGPAGLFEIPEPATRLPGGAPLPVTVLHLSGTAREIGRQHGEAMKDPILEVMHRYQAFVGPQGMDLLALPETTRRLHRLFDEDSLEELRGLAEAVGVSYLYLLAYNLDAALFPALTPGCTQALHLARSNEGRLLHLVNEDSPLLLHLQGLCPRVVQVRRRTDAPKANLRTVMFSMAGQISGPNGARADGLTVTGTTLLDAPPPPQLPDGLPHPQLVKQILEGANGLDDAIDIAKQAHRAGRWSLLVSDAIADAGRYLEYDGDQILQDVAVEGRLSSTNHARSGPADGHTAPEHSAHREARACALLGDGGALSLEAAQAALRDRHDLGRGREVAHPTMNTVRRVDNVMSLVVDPAARTLYVSDRVVPPGVKGEEDVKFLQIRYGDAERVRDVPEVMRRHVIRTRIQDAEPDAGHAALRPKSVLLVGTGPRAKLITTRLRARGVKVVTAPDPAQAQVALERNPEIEALGLVPAPPEPPKIAELRKDSAREGGSAWVLFETAWNDRHEMLLSAQFALLRDWGRRGLVFAVTTLGGGLGFENAAQGVGEQGALLGALKAMRRELDIPALVLDTSPSERAEAVYEALAEELERGAPRLEVGLLRGRRVVLGMPERALEDKAPVEPLPSAWIVTGGGRGVTAKMAARLASLDQPTLHIFGRMPLPRPKDLARWRALDAEGLEAHKRALLEEMKDDADFSPVMWRARCEAIDKALELDGNLAAMRAAGSRVIYYSVDLSDREAVAKAVRLARAEGPLQGILHGAGVEVAKPLEKKDDDLFEATVGGKVDGLVHLLHLTAEDPIRYIVGFSSVSGRFGGHGQVDYAMANEAMAHLLHEHGARHPERRVTAMSWAAFSEVGLAARSSARTFLERSGQAFMTPEEGANHLVRELCAGLPEPEVTICERLEALDLDHLLVPETDRPGWLDAAARLAEPPMLGPLIHHAGDETVVERTLDATEPFLSDHRMGATPILPAVIALEGFFELARSEAARAVRLTEAEILTPLKVPEDGELTVRIARSGSDLALTASHRRPDGVTLEPSRLHVRGRYERLAPVPPIVEPAPKAPIDAALIPYPYPDAPDRTAGSRLIFHGETFRTLEGVLRLKDRAMAKLRVPDPQAAFRSHSGQAFLPVAVLDGCLQATGLLARLRFDVVALPARFEQVTVLPEYALPPGESAILHIESMAKVGDRVVSRLVLHGTGGPWITIEQYEAQCLPDPGAGIISHAEDVPA